MKDGIRCTATHNFDHQIPVADITPDVFDQDLSDVRCLEVVRVTGWFERIPCHAGAESVQPQGQPRSFEPCVTGYEYGLSPETGRVIEHEEVVSRELVRGRSRH